MARSTSPRPDPLVCSAKGHGPFATSNGAAFHATWCAAYRVDHGIPNDAPGVRVTGQREAVTAESVLAAMARRAESAPATAAAAEYVMLPDGRKARIES